MNESVIRFPCGNEILEGSVRFPEGSCPTPIPAAILVHGTLEHDRNGNILKHPGGKEVPERNFFRTIGDTVLTAGCAVFSWDRGGYGGSTGTPADYEGQAEELEAAVQAVTEYPGIDGERIFILGQSAGVYVACLHAKQYHNNRTKQRTQPLFYILQGGLFSDHFKMMQLNYERVVRYHQKSPVHAAWIEANDPWGLAVGQSLAERFEAENRGEEYFDMVCNGKNIRIPLDHLLQREGFKPSDLFSWITTPVLIIHGRKDLNVPFEDAIHAAEKISAAGNQAVRLRIIEDADHSFQTTPDDMEERIKERISMRSFQRPYSNQYMEELKSFIHQQLNSPAPGGVPC